MPTIYNKIHRLVLIDSQPILSKEKRIYNYYKRYDILIKIRYH